MTMEEGATLVNVPRDLFISFIAAKPRTLQIYLHKVRMDDPSSHPPQDVSQAGMNFPCCSISCRASWPACAQCGWSVRWINQGGMCEFRIMGIALRKTSYPPISVAGRF